MRSRIWLLLPILAACSHPAPAKAGATSAVTVGDFQYTAKNGGANVWGPLEVQVTVTATNTTGHAATLDVLGGNCAVLIRIFRKSDRSGRPLYDASSGAECYVKPVHQRLAPHATYTAQSGRYGPAIDIPSGRYYLSALIIPADREQSHIEIPAGDFVVRR
jgi:hypothetical protein